MIEQLVQEVSDAARGLLSVPSYSVVLTYEPRFTGAGEVLAGAWTAQVFTRAASALLMSARGESPEDALTELRSRIREEVGERAARAAHLEDMQRRTT